MERRANSVEGFYAGDISSKVCGKSNSASALNAWTKTLRPRGRRQKLEPFLIGFCVPGVGAVKTLPMRFGFSLILVFSREDERIGIYRHDGEVRLESGEPIWYKCRERKERSYEPAGNKGLSRAYLL
jgi:hypothetical protein